MPGLKSILSSKVTYEITENNLEQGVIYAFSPGTFYTQFCNGFCWKPPASGCAIIEIWGAGGPGARMCCCGSGLPGNAGGYSRKSISVTTANFVCGCVGFPPYAHSLCFQGCGDPSTVCWTSTTSNGCMCARGGKGGISMCSTGTSMFCCFVSQGFCFFGPINDHCGIICNQCSGAWEGLAYGGDINCCGIIGCSSFLGCLPTCPCQFYHHAPLPAYMFSERGSRVTFNTTDGGIHTSGMSGSQLPPYFSALAGMTKQPIRGSFNSYCWRSDRSCGCYEMQGCSPFLPVGAGGLPPQSCPDVRDHGIRGGWGGMRIRFIAS